MRAFPGNDFCCMKQKSGESYGGGAGVVVLYNNIYSA